MKSMSHLFANCFRLVSANTGEWDTSLVEDMDSLFEGCNSL